MEDEPIDPGMGIRTHEEGAKLFPANIELASFETAMINVMSREYSERKGSNTISLHQWRTHPLDLRTESGSTV